MLAKPLTPFQEMAEERITMLATEVGKSVSRREILESEAHFYDKEPQTYVKLWIEGVQIWIFDNEASFEGLSDNRGFERDDFDSDEALLDGLISALRREWQPDQRLRP